MASRRKPVEDARKRLNEKLNSIDEHAAFIKNYVTQITSGVKKTAQDLLGETNKTKFLSKYRTVNQALEKCLDDLLLISETICSLDDQDQDDDEEEGEGDDDEEEENNTVNTSNIQHEEPKESHPSDAAITRNEPLQETSSCESSSDVEITHEITSSGYESQSITTIHQVPRQIKQNTTHSLPGDTDRGKPSIVVPTKQSTERPKPSPTLQPHKQRTSTAQDSNHNMSPNEKQYLGKQDSTGTVQPCSTSGTEITTVKCHDTVQSENITLKQKTRENKEQELLDGQDSCHLVSERSLSPVVVQKKTDVILPNKNKSPTQMFAGDLIEEVLKNGCSDNSIAISSLPTSEKERPALPPFKFPSDRTSLKVAVREIVSPSEFWIQQINGDLDLLMEQMCVFFSKCAKKGDKGGMSSTPELGMVCCGKCTEDDVWYRAIVSAISPDSAMVEVLYVDEGNREMLPLSKLRPLDEKFFKLPCQALCCCLSGIQLNNNASIEKVNDWFKRRVSGETLEAVLQEGYKLTTSPGIAAPIHLYIRPHNTPTSSKVQHLKLEYNIHEMMIREGLSKRILSPSNADESISPTSSYSDNRSGTRTESMRSTSTSSHDVISLPKQNQPSAMETQVMTCDSSTVVARPQGCYGNESRVPPPVIQLDFDGSLFLLVSLVVNPGEFYVHVISRDAGKLDILMGEMNKTYGETSAQIKQTTQENFSPRVGDFCCAKFSVDGAWYRAVILQIRHKSSITAEVFYIDFGNIESVRVENLRRLLPQFMKLPMQTVRCSLAGIQPNVSEIRGDYDEDDVFHNEPQNRQRRSRGGSHAQRRSSRGTRGRRRPSSPRDENTIDIAAGDEDTDEDPVEPILDTKELRSSRTSIKEDINKNHRRLSALSDTAVELFEKVWSGGGRDTGSPPWSHEATELFMSLTKSAKKFVGFVVPWDSRMVNDIANYLNMTECSLPNLGPVLVLNLYDVSDERDVFINGAMVEANVAVSTVVRREKTQASNVRVVKMTHQDLTLVSESLPAPVSQLSRSSPTNPSNPTRPASPTTDLLDNWNPMSHEHQSFRNTYTVNTENVEVAIEGYEEHRGKICRYFLSKYGCYQGSRCPNEHVRQDPKKKTSILAGHTCAELPDVGSWVAVRITAVYDPGHFCVQMPFGNKSLDTQIIKSRSGKETSGEENVKNLEDLMEEMGKYSKTLGRQRSIAPFTLSELVIIRHNADNQWYRARIHEQIDDKYQAALVDYGFFEWVEKSDVLPIIPQFLHLPFQAVECYLANIRPSIDTENRCSLWSEESLSHFTSLVEDKILVCQVVSINDREHTMVVELYDTTDTKEINIAEAMIDCGLANLPYHKLNYGPQTTSLLNEPIIVGKPG